MHSVGREFKEQFIGNGEDDAVGWLVDIDCAPFAAGVLGDQSSVWWRYFIGALFDSTIQCYAGVGRGQQTQQSAVDAFSDTAIQGLLPSVMLKEPSQYFVTFAHYTMTKLHIIFEITKYYPESGLFQIGADLVVRAKSSIFVALTKDFAL